MRLAPDTLLKQEGLQLAEASFLDVFVWVFGFRSQVLMDVAKDTPRCWPKSFLSWKPAESNAAESQCISMLEDVGRGNLIRFIQIPLIWQQNLLHGLFPAHQYPLSTCSGYSDGSLGFSLSRGRSTAGLKLGVKWGYHKQPQTNTKSQSIRTRSEVWKCSLPNSEVSNTHRHIPHPLLLSLGNKPGWEFRWVSRGLNLWGCLRTSIALHLETGHSFVYSIEDKRTELGLCQKKLQCSKSM